jgi:photosystem II stability/assembly factor-like uncharacterized protein
VTVTTPPRTPPRPGPPPGDPEALIREARRRGRRRRLATAAALLALGAGAFFAFRGGGGHRPTGAGSAGGGRATRAQALRAIDRAAARATIVEAGSARGVLWAMNGLALWLTTDGGRTWRVVTPPHVGRAGDVVARVDQVVFADARHGWITASDLPGTTTLPNGSLRHFELERTDDGGRRWHALVPPGCAACGGARVAFVDARHGFLLAARRPRARLYATADGGRSWRLVARPPFAGPIAFADARRGLGAAGATLYVTRDGGRRWRVVRLPGPAGPERSVGGPTFFGAVAAVPILVRDRATKSQRLVVVVSRDGGVTWSARPAPRSADLRAYGWGPAGGITAFSAATASDWKLLVGPTIFTTTDAGRSWTTARAVYAPPAPRVWDVGFTTATDGWAIFGVRSGAALVRTTDGGRRWRPVTPAR